MSSSAIPKESERWQSLREARIAGQSANRRRPREAVDNTEIFG